MITVGKGSYVSDDHHEYFNPTVKIANFTSVADKVTFCGAMNHAWVGNNKYVSTFPFNHVYANLPFIFETVTRGEIVIGNDVWIGAQAFILDGAKIGDGAIIGAKAVVAGEIPPYAVVVGNPAVVKHYRYTPEQIEKLLKIKWYDWPDDVIISRIHDFKDIDIFLEKYYYD